MANQIPEILKAAENDKIETKLTKLEKEPTELYEIIERLKMIVKKGRYEEFADLSNYDLFNIYFCFNNDTISLIQVQQIQYFDTSATYEELYSVVEESKEYIDSWTFQHHYDLIRKAIDAKNQSQLIEACQSLGLSPYIISYDIAQPFIAMTNLLFFKKQIKEIQSSNKAPSLKRKEIRDLYNQILQNTINVIIERYDYTKKFYKQRKMDCDAKIECAEELIQAADEGKLDTLDLIEGKWHQFLNPSVLNPLYELLIDNQRDRHKRITQTNEELTKKINETPFINYLYQNNIDPNSLQEDLLIKANTIPFPELEKKINFFLKLSISLEELLLLHIHYLFNIELSTIDKLTFYIDKNIIKRETLKEDLTIIDKLHIIDTNYSILKTIIDITSPYYKDTILLLPTTEIKRRLTILSEHNLSTNNYMFLLNNFNYLNIYDLLIENNIPTYLFIPICKTDNPLLTIKKIMISKELDIPYENNGRLTKEIRNINAFMCPNELVDDYIEDAVSEYMIGDIKGSSIESIKQHQLVKDLDSSHRYGDVYIFGSTRISRPKVLSKLQTILNKKQDLDTHLLFCIISNSILSDKNIVEIKKSTITKK